MISDRYCPEIYGLVDFELGLIKIGWAFYASSRVDQLWKAYPNPVNLDWIWCLQHRCPEFFTNQLPLTRENGIKAALSAESYFHRRMLPAANPLMKPSDDGATEWFFYDPERMVKTTEAFIDIYRHDWIRVSP